MFLSFGGATKLEDQFSYNNYESHDPQATLVEKSMSVTNLNTDVSNIERLNRWVSALRMFEERPFTGFGPGTYQFTYLPFQEKRLANRLTEPIQIPLYRAPVVPHIQNCFYNLVRTGFGHPVVFISLAALDVFWLLYSEQTKHSYTATFRSEHLPFSYAIQ